mmetsp:Transcript_17721/g.51789  ORF Transcript_17721/g.51789 Transcript_17721/m.51789 type:complete len:204 (-) Transcript_17721:101-712(-)
MGTALGHRRHQAQVPMVVALSLDPHPGAGLQGSANFGGLDGHDSSQVIHRHHAFAPDFDHAHALHELHHCGFVPTLQVDDAFRSVRCHGRHGQRFSFPRQVPQLIRERQHGLHFLARVALEHEDCVPDGWLDTNHLRRRNGSRPMGVLLLAGLGTVPLLDVVDEVLLGVPHLSLPPLILLAQLLVHLLGPFIVSVLPPLALGV